MLIIDSGVGERVLRKDGGGFELSRRARRYDGSVIEDDLK